MSWYENAAFYHIYPLGLTGAPRKNDYGAPVHRLCGLESWIRHIRSLGCTVLYIGPLFQSVGHGYETTDYRCVDSRLGTNEDLAEFVRKCHKEGIRVILDAVFNHTGRDFFAYRDLREHREQSRFRDWYCRVDFSGDNGFHDGFSCENWGGYDLLAKLNLRNPEVREYHLETVRFWQETFGIDGLRLDAADVLDFDFMRALRAMTERLAPDFFLLGEVIHGDYVRWANGNTLHAVTNYHLHKALYSAHNDRNYFEIAHTVRRQKDAGLTEGGKLYNFLDNHDVERIASKLRNPAHLFPVLVLLFALPGMPSIYYGSEFGIRGKKERWSDDSLRPCLDLASMLRQESPVLSIVRALGGVYRDEAVLRTGAYRELSLKNTAYAFARGDVLVSVNCADEPATLDIPAFGAFRGSLTGQRAADQGGRLHFQLPANSGEIWIPEGAGRENRNREMPAVPVQYAEMRHEAQTPCTGEDLPPRAAGKPYEEMNVQELQAEVLAKLAACGPVTERMRREASENVYRNSLLNWVRSFK